MTPMTLNLVVQKSLSYNPPSRLKVDIRTSPITGRLVRHFPYMAISDIHWGSKFCRAKRLCMALRDFESDELKLLGDVFGGIEMRKKDTWHLGPWHRQGMAQILRKAETSRVTILRGNHEVGLDRYLQTPKTIFGIEYRQESSHRDPQGRLFLEEHNDKYDLEVFKTPEKQAFWHNKGDTLHCIGGEVDHILQNNLGLENASVANWCKLRFKDFINGKMGILASMEQAIDASSFDGNIGGHSHMQGFHRTPGGKLLINPGSCTEHVKFVVHDDSNWGLVVHHRDRIEVEMEDGNKYTEYHKDIGLDMHTDVPESKEDDYTARTDRLLRLAYRLWPARDRQDLTQKLQEKDNMVSRLERALCNDQGASKPSQLYWGLQTALVQRATLEALRQDNPIPRHQAGVRKLALAS